MSDDSVTRRKEIPSEQLDAYFEALTQDQPPALTHPILSGAMLNTMLASIVNGVLFEDSPLAGEPDYVREAWGRMERSVHEGRERGAEVVPANDID